MNLHITNYTMSLALDYINSFPQTLPSSLIHKILNMRPRHPVAELLANETLELMHSEMSHFYLEGSGHVWNPYTPLNIDVSEDQILKSCMFPLHRQVPGPRQDEWTFAECFFFCYLWRKGRHEYDWAVWSEDSEGEYCISCYNLDCTCRVYFEDDLHEKYLTIY